MRRLFILLIIIFIVQQTYGQSFKVVAYLPDYRFSILTKIDYAKTTHVIAAFANPDSSGVLSFSQNINTFVTNVHNGGAKAMVSLGGGGDYSWGNSYHTYEYLFRSAADRTNFVVSIMNYVRAHHLDGIDLDLEGNALQLSNYNIFSQELADSLHLLDLTISGAYVSGSWAPYVSNQTLQKLDFITTQSYGGVGDWNWNNPSDQAPFSMFKSDIDFWKTRGLTASKILGGLPFYVVQFPITESSTPPPAYWPYEPTLCSIYESAALAPQEPLKYDLVYTDDGNGDPIYLNSLPTFKKKIQYAAANAGGIMIWEIGSDCYDGTLNVLDTLATYISQNVLSIETKTLSSDLKFYPNPANGFIKLEGQYQSITSYIISDMYGRTVMRAVLTDPIIDVSNVESGMYLFSITKEDNSQYTTKLLIQR